MSVITGQMPGVARHGGAADRTERHAAAGGPPYTALGNANALAQWEYCFDRGDTRHQPRRHQQLGLLGPGQPERG